MSREQVAPVADAVQLLVAELGDVPLIGFAGAPFTLASYLVEGGPSRNHERTKAMMLGEPDTWHALMAALTDLTIAFLKVQLDAGVDAIQMFDSWAGTLSLADYRTHVLPHSTRVFDGAGRRRRADDALRGRHRGAARRDVRGRRAGRQPRRRRGLAHLADRRRGPGGARHRAAGQPRSGGAAGGRGRWSSGRLARSSRTGAVRSTRVPRATSSTSATGCCLRPILECITEVVALVHSL